jgi:hypothetical protein
VHTIPIFDQDLAAVVIVGFTEKQRGRDVGPQPMAGVDLADRVVDVRAKGLAPFIFIEKRGGKMRNGRAAATKSG